ncbi:uncharacterized protein K02A2.6-like [Ylistrum balloti]|uniref:uncharacterized protein K02A2.6-like n=1 Tax=Ylistrum balloti TaxID=509963 RepID=UPI002905841C|nr:uncharacterized protein K02A2.6-like [Ylistrum balloti]
MSVSASARMQRYAVFLSGYTYSIQYKNTKLHGNADGLSRLPLKSARTQSEREILDESHLFQVSQIETLPVSASDIVKGIRKSPTLCKVLNDVLHGWSQEDKAALPFYDRRNDITVQQGILLWGIRVIIPEELQPRVLEELHSGHPGIVKMKALARSHVWWPWIDKDLDQLAKNCNGCQGNRNTAKEAPVHPWEFPMTPWQRIHVDFAGPFLNSMFLVVVDAHSKWPEVVQMGSTTASKTIEVLRCIFARNGIPQQLVSDNGPQFVSSEFQDFMRGNGIHHITSAPYHPRTNGLAERFVQTFKQGLKSALKDNGSIQRKLQCFLMSYRNTPQSTTGETPASLFMGRNLRTRLDLLRPNLKERVEKAQARMCKDSNLGKTRSFEVGD